MQRVVILTPNPDDMAYAGRWSEVRDRMVGPLRAEGFEVDSRSWFNDAGGLGGYDLILPLTVWGYHRDHHDWLATIEGWEFEGLPVLNPTSVLRWNSDKRYLGRLFRLGAPVVPTLFVDELDAADVERAAREFHTETLIVKPQVSASAYRTLKIRPGDPIEDGPEGPAMIQPFLDQVGGEGELSLVYFNGEYSHAIRKVAARGDFRVQPEWGGHITDYTPDADVRAAAERVLESVEEPLLYARVDLVRDNAGRPQLMELELVEPDLYLGYTPEAPRRFAKAVREAVEGL